MEDKNSQEEQAVLNGQTVMYKRMFRDPTAKIKTDEDIINGAVLTMEHSFGYLNTAIYKNAQFISEDTIVYPCGMHLATLDLVSRRMDFIKREDTQGSKITALSVGFSRKKELVIGIGEVLKNNVPRVSIYIPSRLRWFYLDHETDVIPFDSQDEQVD